MAASPRLPPPPPSRATDPPRFAPDVESAMVARHRPGVGSIPKDRNSLVSAIATHARQAIHLSGSCRPPGDGASVEEIFRSQNRLGKASREGSSKIPYKLETTYLSAKATVNYRIHMRFAFALALTGILLCAAAVSVRAQSYTYELLPGSTITPASGATLTGPAEALSGTFTLTADPGNSNSQIFAFLISAINLTSSNYTLTMNPVPQWISESEGGEFVFNADVNITGNLSGPYSLLAVYGGTYAGSTSGDIGPTEIDTNELGIAPDPSGGLWSAQAQFDAIEIPEPSTLGILSCGVGLFLGGGKRRHLKIRP